MYSGVYIITYNVLSMIHYGIYLRLMYAKEYISHLSLENENMF